MKKDGDNIISIADRKRAMEIGDILDSSELSGLFDDLPIDSDSLFNEDENLRKLNKRHALVLNPEGFKQPMIMTYVPPLREDEHAKIKFITPESFNIIYCNQWVMIDDKNGTELGKFWLKSSGRREYISTFFDPNLPKEYNKSFNMWQGMCLTPKKGNWSRTKKHIYKILCNGDREKFDYVIKWFAWCVQNPGSQAEVALVFKGMQGCGKGVIFNQFCKIFGNHASVMAGSKSLTADFNDELDNKVFLFCDEAFTAGDRESESILKNMITEDTISTMAKFQSRKKIKNCLHIVMASNEDWVVPMGVDSRRFFVNECTNTYAKNQCSDQRRNEYFDFIYEELRHGGREAMLYDLLKMNLKGYHPRFNVPDTEESLAQKEYSLTRVYKYMLEFIREGIFPVEPIKGEYMLTYPAFRDFMVINYPAFKTVSTHNGTRMLRELGCDKRHTARGNMWVFPRLEVMRDLWYRTKFPEQFEGPQEWRVYTHRDNKDNITPF